MWLLVLCRCAKYLSFLPTSRRIRLVYLYSLNPILTVLVLVLIVVQPNPNCEFCHGYNIEDMGSRRNEQRRFYAVASFLHGPIDVEEVKIDEEIYV